MSDRQSSDAFVIRPGEARRISSAARPDVLLLASAATTDGSLTVIETGGTAVGSGPPMHIHHRDNEAFYVLSGRYRMQIAGRDYVCPAGSFIYVPMGTVHGFVALESGTRKLNIFAPAAMEGFFVELDVVMGDGGDPTRLRELNERYATEVVGPIPEGYR